MQNSLYPLPPRYLCTKEAARFLCLSARTLEPGRFVHPAVRPARSEQRSQSTGGFYAWAKFRRYRV